MALKDNLQHIFNSDYPGTDTFINEVIIPVFGDDIDIVNIDQAEKEEYREKAAKAGLKKIVYAADIHDEEYRANNIAFFDVTVDNNVNVERARVNIQQVIRSIVDHHSHILIVFHYEDVENKSWRFSYAYKQGSIANTTSAKRYTYVFGRDFRGRTAAERFEAFKKSDHSNKALEEAFSVEALSDEFFDIYRAYYATFVEYITGEKYSDEKKLKNIMTGWNWRTKDTSDQFTTTFDHDAKATRDYIKKMFGRIVFLYFLQRKGWLYDNEGRSDAQYMKHLFDNAGTLQATFLDDVLEILFFYVLNTKPGQRVAEAETAHKDVTILPGWNKIPFLNGGLFEQDDIDPKKCAFPAEYFREFFNFLNSYNFTIDENDQEDAEIGIDPEMLGRIFENLLEDNKDKGAFYTPKPIVDYMCQESIIAYLQDDRYKPEGNELIRKFIETLNINILNDEQRIEIEKKLLKVKICDPAIGSGAFPMGLVNLLSKIFIVLRTYSTIDQAKMKRYIMQQSIYGVDIEKGAVDIARLRFWLAMVVDESEPQPLPNLHFKIMQGNSLLEYFKGKDLSALCRPVDSKGRYVMSFNNDREQLQKSIKRFYATSEHEERKQILDDISKNVRRQIFELTQSEEIGKIDPSETDQFFLWHTWFSDVFDNGGFDIVIGNPPYIRRTNLPTKDKSIYEKQYFAAKGQYDIYLLFIEFGITALKNNGTLCFINPLRFFNADYGTAARTYISNKSSIMQIIDVSQLKVFQNAMTYPCILLLKKNITEDNILFVRPSSLEEIASIPVEKKLYFNPDAIRKDRAKRFLIGEDKLQVLIKRIESKTKPFAMFFDVARGLANNHVNFKGNSDKALKSKQVKKYRLEGEFVPVEVADATIFSNEMIIMPRTVEFLQATLKPKHIVCLDRIYYLIKKENVSSNIPFLGVFNSKLINFWFEYNYWSTKVSGNYFDLNGTQILSIPFPEELLHNTEFNNLVIDALSNITEATNKIDEIIFKLFDVSEEEMKLMSNFMTFNGHKL